MLISFKHTCTCISTGMHLPYGTGVIECLTLQHKNYHFDYHLDPHHKLNIEYRPQNIQYASMGTWLYAYDMSRTFNTREWNGTTEKYLLNRG